MPRHRFALNPFLEQQQQQQLLQTTCPCAPCPPTVTRTRGGLPEGWEWGPTDARERFPPRDDRARPDQNANTLGPTVNHRPALRERVKREPYSTKRRDRSSSSPSRSDDEEEERKSDGYSSAETAD